MDSDISQDQIDAVRFRALFASTSQGILAVDHRGIIQMINSKAESLFGYPRGELLGRNIGVLIPERVRAIHAEEVREYTGSPRSRSMGIGVDLRGRRRDNTEFPVEVSLNTVQVGQQMMIFALVVDVTERVEIEELSRRDHTMDAIAHFATGLAWQFGTLIADLSGHVSAALKRCEADVVSRDLLDAVSMLADRGAQLRDQLFTIGGAHEVHPEWFDPNQRLSQMQDLLAEVLGPGIELDCVFGEDLGEIFTDPRQMERAIVILARNARQTMPNGGAVTIETAAVEITEGQNDWFLPVNPGPHIMLTVSETGAGIKPLVPSHVFEPFFVTTEPSGDGSGLGLATLYGIVKSCGWSIRAVGEQSVPMFQIVFPLVQEIDD